ncbi:MAG TPA: LCP family protein [Candidatus Merdenecus merdavium]|nr:LCP family protein [Candidatus Merdenecus merdavium]
MKKQKNVSRKKTRAYKKRRNRRIIFTMEVIVLLLAIGVLYVVNKLNKIGSDDLNLELVETNPGVSSNEVLDGYTNIALFGVDSREANLDAGALSDMIMIASINNKTKEVRLVSVYRDSLLDTKNGSFRKATEAFSLGGKERAISMLNINLDLDIKAHVIVDFNAVAEVVDLLDGIDLEITDDEMVHINNYCVETSRVTGKDYTPLQESGMVHLNGVQAVSYSRIRQTEGGDFQRSARQRFVIGLLVDKLKASDILTINKIIDKVFPMVSTSFTKSQILGMVVDALNYELGETGGFPTANKPYNDIYINGEYRGHVIVPVTLEENVKQLHQFLFGDEAYTPSSKVQEISQEIINITGYTSLE